MFKLSILLIIFTVLPILAVADAGSNGTLILFSRSDCPPCLQEMKIVPELAREHENLEIKIIFLDKKYPAYAFAPNVRVVLSGEKENEILVNSGNRKFVLPFSMFLNKNGGICARHYGILGTELVNKWVKKC